MNLFATKPLSRIMTEAEGEHSLKRTLGPVQLVALGIGAIIGAGLFSLTGIAASMHAGPAVVLAFVLAAFGCAFAGLCYSEFSTMIPIAGSAYTYSYATMGELRHGSSGGILCSNMRWARRQSRSVGPAMSRHFLPISASSCRRSTSTRPGNRSHSRVREGEGPRVRDARAGRGRDRPRDHLRPDGVPQHRGVVPRRDGDDVVRRRHDRPPQRDPRPGRRDDQDQHAVRRREPDRARRLAGRDGGRGRRRRGRRAARGQPAGRCADAAARGRKPVRRLGRDLRAARRRARDHRRGRASRGQAVADTVRGSDSPATITLPWPRSLPRYIAWSAATISSAPVSPSRG